MPLNRCASELLLANPFVTADTETATRPNQISSTTGILPKNSASGQKISDFANKPPQRISERSPEGFFAEHWALSCARSNAGTQVNTTNKHSLPNRE